MCYRIVHEAQNSQLVHGDKVANLSSTVSQTSCKETWDKVSPNDLSLHPPQLSEEKEGTRELRDL